MKSVLSTLFEDADVHRFETPVQRKGTKVLSTKRLGTFAESVRRKRTCTLDSFPATLVDTSPVKPGTKAAAPDATTLCLPRPILNARACNIILAQIHGLQDGPVKLLCDSTERQRLADPEEAVVAVAEALVELESTLEDSLRRATAAAGAVKTGKAQLAETRSDLKAAIVRAKSEIAAKKAELSAAADATAESVKGVSDAEAAAVEAERVLKTLQTKHHNLEDVFAHAYAPVRDGAVTGASGRKVVQSLKRAGKEHGLHTELMAILPNIARKQMDKRRTFDGLAIQSLGSELQKRTDMMQATMAELQRSVDHRRKGVSAAEEAVARSKEHSAQLTAALREQQIALSAVQEAFAASKPQRSSMGTANVSASDTSKKLTRARARLNKFRRGPLASFQKAINKSPRDVMKDFARVQPLAELQWATAHDLCAPPIALGIAHMTCDAVVVP